MKVPRISIASEIAVGEDSSELKTEDAPVPDFRMQAARRQSRMTQFICQVKDEDEMENAQSDFEKAVRNMQKKKMKKNKVIKLDEEKGHDTKKWEKLTLVWKCNQSQVIIAKKPQVCLEELINQKLTHKSNQKQKKLRVGYKYSGQMNEQSLTKKKVSRLKSETFTKPSQYQMEAPTEISSLIEMHCGYYMGNPDKKSTMTSPMLTMTTPTISQTNSYQHNETYESILPRIDATDASVVGSTASIKHSKGKHPRMRRLSKTIFSTKKGTCNEESCMYANSTNKSGYNRTMKSKDNDEGNAFQRIRYKTHEMSKNEKIVPELKGKVAPQTLVKAFISEQFLGLHLQGQKTEKVRKLYEYSIMNEKSIRSLIIKHPEMVPAKVFRELITYKKQFEAAPVSIPHASENTPWRDFFHETLSVKGKNMLEELEYEIPIYTNFYKNLITERASKITINQQLVKERRKSAIRDVIIHMTLQLRTSRKVPGSPIRQEVMSIIAAAGYNDVLLLMLAQSVDTWLDQLAKCLGSPYKSIREETCQILCYLTMSYPLMRALYISKYFDVVHDLMNILLRSIDSFDDSFDDYYIVIVHLLHHTPSRGALDCILDRINMFKSVELIRRWPRLTYYAFKYWPDDPLGIKSPLYGMRVVKVLETALQKPLTQKFARQALHEFQLRYNNVSRIFTILSEKAEKAYLIALGSA